MAKRKKTNQQLGQMSLLDAFEALRSEGVTEADSVTRMLTVARFNHQTLAAVAQMVYRPFGDDEVQS